MKNSPAEQITAFVVKGLALMASACNTVEGVGQDLESAGDAAERTTEDIAN